MIMVLARRIQRAGAGLETVLADTDGFRVILEAPDALGVTPEVRKLR